MEPLRTCVGCRTVAGRSELLRLVMVDGLLVVDADARLPGRGAWLHPDRSCCEQAVKRGGFARALRTRVDATHLLDTEPWMVRPVLVEHADERLSAEVGHAALEETRRTSLPAQS